MDKTSIKNFAVWARRRLIREVADRAGLYGVTGQGAAEPLPQSTEDLQFFDIGTKQYAEVRGQQIPQRRALAQALRQRERQMDRQAAFESLVEEVAYTWFNRLIAIRFMEVNDYLPGRVRVLSAENPAKTEPDLVTAPFDAGLPFTQDEREFVLHCKQQNQLDELFRMLFIKQCNALNAILPELFEPTNDYTELLLPLSFTDKDGVVYRLTHDLAQSDFDISTLNEAGQPIGQVEIIGWLYQYYNTEPKEQVFALLKKNIKVTKERIPAATQLFTPHWIVQYMVQNSLGRVFVNSLVASGQCLVSSEQERIQKEREIADRMGWKYYLPEAEQTPEVRAQLTTNLTTDHFPLTTILDPCMGSGHILVYAFELLMQIYLARGYTQRDAARQIVQKNLYGLELDKRAYQLAYFAVMMKARQYDRRFFESGIRPNLCHPGEDPELLAFGSLVTPGPEYAQAEPDAGQSAGQLGFFDMPNCYRQLLAQKYDIIVTNPPYMGSGNMNERLSEFVKENYPDSKSDLFACFIQRCQKLVKPDGYQSMITQHSWMFLSSYEKLRIKLREVTLINMAHLGARAFEEISGEVVQTTSFVLQNRHIERYQGSYVRLVNYNSQQEKENAFRSTDHCPLYTAIQENFFKIPGSPIAYWVSKRLISLLGQSETIGQSMSTGSGLSTANNERFLRFFWEVNREKIAIFQKEKKKWFFFQKGGEYRKWYGNLYYVVNWENNGAAIKHWVTHNPNDSNTTSWSRRIFNTHLYFQQGITWSVISSGNISFRVTDKNAMISNAAGGVFGFDNEQQRNTFMAAINTKIWTILFAIINPTPNYSSGVIQKAPLPILPKTNLGTECVNISKTDWDNFEISWDFTHHPLI